MSAGSIPWPRREEALLRERLNDEKDRKIKARGKAKRLVQWIIETGLEPSGELEPLPPVLEEDVRLICWLAVTPE